MQQGFDEGDVPAFHRSWHTLAIIVEVTKSTMRQGHAGPDVHGKVRLMPRGVAEVRAERVEILVVNPLFFPDEAQMMQ